MSVANSRAKSQPSREIYNELVAKRPKTSKGKKNSLEYITWNKLNLKTRDRGALPPHGVQSRQNHDLNSHEQGNEDPYRHVLEH